MTWASQSVPIKALSGIHGCFPVRSSSRGCLATARQEGPAEFRNLRLTRQARVKRVWTASAAPAHLTLDFFPITSRQRIDS